MSLDVDLLPWSMTLKIVACVFHSVAIACTVFRLMYRWYMARFWWEDGWAAFALVVDIPCLVATWVEIPLTLPVVPPIDRITNWIVALAFPCVLWACRISILFSIVRVANPSEHLRRIAFVIGCSFIIMCAALVGQKIQICLENNCKIATSVGLSQLITDVISDLSLVVLPVYLLRRTRITHRQRITIFSVFSASLLISAVTIFHSIVLFTIESSGIIVIGHVKTALALIVCNLLVIVSFIYRMCHLGKSSDLEATEEPDPLTNVNLDTGLTESSADKYTTTASSDVSRWTAFPSTAKSESATGSRPAPL